MKKVLILGFLLLLTACTNEIDTTEVKEEDPVKEEETAMFEDLEITASNTMTLYAEDLMKHTKEINNLTFVDGYFEMEDEHLTASFETSIINTENFIELVPSINVLLNEQSSVSLLVSAGNEDGMSEYLPLFLFKETYKQSFDGNNEYIKNSIDTITPLKTITKLQFKVVMKKDAKLRNISFTMKKDSNFVRDYGNLTQKEISVTPRQQLSIPNVGNIICSPTSVSMLLEYNGIKKDTVDVSKMVYDEGASIYGNWTFNASHPSIYHLHSRVEYVNNLNTLIRYIEDDTPLALSIKTSNKNQLQGSIMAYPGGHLVVLSGFTYKSDAWYAVVLDPAEYEDGLVRREYLLDELLDAMSGYVYVISKEELK